jgi:hypothetical protein
VTEVREPIGDPDGDADFAEEHEDTAVDRDITAGRDEGENESPRGWDGQEERPGPP